MPESTATGVPGSGLTLERLRAAVLKLHEDADDCCAHGEGQACCLDPNPEPGSRDIYRGKLDSVLGLVAAAIREAVAEERERCAEVVQAHFGSAPDHLYAAADTSPGVSYELGRRDRSVEAAAAIRARKTGESENGKAGARP